MYLRNENAIAERVVMFSRDQTPTGTFLMVANNYCTCTSTLARELSTSTTRVASELASASDSSFFSWPSFLCAFVLDICDRLQSFCNLVGQDRKLHNWAR